MEAQFEAVRRSVELDERPSPPRRWCTAGKTATYASAILATESRAVEAAITNAVRD